MTTGAEGFVILSGFMLGMLNRVRLQKAVLLTVGWGLYLRAWKIYQVNIIIIVSFLLLRYFPFINAFGSHSLYRSFFRDQLVALSTHPANKRDVV